MEQFNTNQEKICNLNIKNDSLQTAQSQEERQTGQESFYCRPNTKTFGAS